MLPCVAGATGELRLGMTPMPTVVLPGPRMQRTRGRQGVSSGGVGIGRRGAVVFICPLRTMPVVYGGVAVLVRSVEPLVGSHGGASSAHVVLQDGDRGV